MFPVFDAFVSDAPLPLVAGAFMVALILAREVGGGLHRALGGSRGTEGADETLIVSGVLGLLALLVAFTFSLALSRYEDRRDLIVQEANDIGTAYMRLQLLDEPGRSRASALMRDYAAARVAFGDAGPSQRPAALARADALQAPLWRATLDALGAARRTPTESSVVSALNSVFDTASERQAALDARLPAAVLEALAAFSLVSAALVGYALAGMRSSHRTATLLLFTLLSLAVVLILDLDRPRSGSIRTPQAPMHAMLKSLPSLTAAP